MVKQLLFLVSLLIVTSSPLVGQNFNRPVPAGLPRYEFVSHGNSTDGYYLNSPFKLAAGPGALNQPKYPMILDARGYLVWYMRVAALNAPDFKYHPAEQVYSFVKFQNPLNAQFMLLDDQFQLIDSLTTVDGILPDIHDFQISANQTYLLAGVSDSIMDLSAYLFNGVPGSPNTHVDGFVIQEFDKNHNLLFQWDSNDHIHPTKAYHGFYGYSPAGFDYCHGNSIEEDDDGHLLVSFRHLNAVYKINRNTGQVIWELGGKTSSFTFPNDPGFSGQHDARRLPNGNIALFDNANMAAPPRISRAVEYQLDTVNWTATKVWEYQYSPGFLSSAMGSHQTSPDREHLLGYGLVYRPHPSLVLTDDAGQLLSELFFQDSFMSYRSFWFDLPLEQIQRPAISCSQAGGLVTLTAPAGFDRYEWSTGEKTPEITIQQPGAYQVWVNNGMGMLGSEPFIVADLANACPLSATQTPVTEAQEISAVFDLWGRRVQIPERDRLYVIQYAGGQVELKIWRTD